MNTKALTVLTILCMLTVSVLVGTGHVDGDSSSSPMTDADGGEINTNAPYYAVTKNGVTTYYQAISGDGQYYLVSPSTVDDKSNFIERQDSGVTSSGASYNYNNYEIMTADAFNGADLVITIPTGTTLSCFDRANLAASGYEWPHGVEFNKNLNSITIEGEGTITSGSGSGGNLVLGFNGVSTTIDGITLATAFSVVFGGSIDPEGDLAKTNLIIDDLTVQKTTYIVAGSRHADVTTTNITINGLTVTSGSVSVYGGNLNTIERHGELETEGDVTTSNVSVTGGSIYGIYGGGSGDNKTGTTNLEVTGGTIARVFGGGNAGSATDSTNVLVGGNANITQRVFGGGWNANCGVSNVVVTGGDIASDVVGGGFENSEVKSASIVFSGGTVGRGIVAGGLAYTAGNTSQVGAASVFVSGGTVGTDPDEERGIRDYSVDGSGSNSVGTMVVKVTGGTIDSIKVKSSETVAEIEVTGGTFVETVDESWIPNGSEITIDENGNYVIISPTQPPVSWDDDEELPPFIPTQPADDDDTVTIVACAAAAAVAAILAVFLVIDRKG